jgi:hypothetical protein
VVDGDQNSTPRLPFVGAMHFVTRARPALSSAPSFDRLRTRRAQPHAHPLGFLTLSLSKGEDAPKGDTAHRPAPPRNRFATGSQRPRNRFATVPQPGRTGDSNPINGLAVAPQRTQRISPVAMVAVHDIEDPAAGRRIGT